MSIERSGLIKFKGRDAIVIGADLKVGDQAPEFYVHTQDWLSIAALESTSGKVRIIAAVPSLDTEVCDRETRRFNQDATALGQDVAILVISADLPFAQKRWCGAAGVDQVTVLSDHWNVDFGTKYGCLIKEARILRRAVFVVDKTGKLTYSAYMPALGEEPDYPALLTAVKQSLI